MQEKKFDLNSLIGFVLLGAIMLFYFYTNQPTPQELKKEKENKTVVQDSIQKSKQDLIKKDNKLKEVTAIKPSDTLALAKAEKELGDFAYSATLPSASDKETVLENNLLKIKVFNKGGQITEVLLKNIVTYDSLPLYLIKNKNAKLNINFDTSDNRNIDTKDLFFEPILTKKGKNQILTMKLKIAKNKFLEYQYILKPNDYMLGFKIHSQGLSNAINSSKPITLNWDLKGYRHEKSVKYENQYTNVRYEYDNNKYDYLNAHSKHKEEVANHVNWIDFKQQFFSSILIADKPFNNVKLISENLVNDEQIDTVFTKNFKAIIPLKTENGEFSNSLKIYYGPTDYHILQKYKGLNLDRAVNLGWGIFGWLNRYFFVPFFAFLKGLNFSVGLIIILMTITVRIFMSPLVYKSYLSSAKMKVLKPEIDELTAKFKGKENAMKRQQATMALYSKAGVSPMAGCIPAVLQMPVFFALFRFFPSSYALRQHGFLWAKDLSAYDEVIKLPFRIPLYGDHISLFPILASIAIFFYMQMTTGQQMQQTQQPGMPNMKFMMYLSPIMMLFFFNSYSSGLSLYYFVSNLLTISIMLVVKYYIIDEEKIHAKIQENKKKPKKQSKFRQRLNDAMKQAQDQQDKKRK